MNSTTDDNARRPRWWGGAPARVWCALLALALAVPFYALASFSAHHGAPGWPRGEGALALSHHGSKGFHHRHNPFLGHHHHLHGANSEWSLGHMFASHHGDMAYCGAALFVIIALWLFFIGNPFRWNSVTEPKRPMTLAKEQDVLLLHHAYPALGFVLILVFLLLSLTSHVSFSDDPGGVARGLVLFLASGFTATLAIWAARQFERYLQNGRFAQAVDMLATAAGESGDTRERRRDAALVLLDDISEPFLRSKRHRIAAVLKMLGVENLEAIRQICGEESRLERTLGNLLSDEGRGR